MPQSNCTVFLHDGVCKELIDPVHLETEVDCELALGGYAYPIQHDPSTWPDDDDDAMLLLARACYTFVDEPFDCVAHWTIRRRDLVERQFDQVEVHLDAYM